MTIALHWFRTDLRSTDNLGLLAAQRSGHSVVGLYIATPAQWDKHDDAFIKRDFWRRSLRVLEDDLHQLGIPLMYLQVSSYRDIPALLATVLPALGVTELHLNREYPLNERQRDENVAALCNRLGVAFHAHDDSVLVPPRSVLNKSGQPFKVFTPYARAMRELLQVADMRGAKLQQQAMPVMPSLPQRKFLHELDFGPARHGHESLWPAGELNAALHLQQFCKNRIADYRNNRDLPAVNGTSRMSPHLAAGTISVRQCWQQAGVFAEGDGVLSWQNELLWREFYRYVMWHFPHVCRHEPWRGDLGHVPWRHDEAEFHAWSEGRTGIPIVDAAMRQLLNEGWMHNRLRMLSATFLCKHLLIDWRWGERWFMRHLVDGDFAANNGGWQWCASTGTDAAPYFRIFNPVTQSRRFDPDAAFLRRYLPELQLLDDTTIHDPGIVYMNPIVDLAFGRERALRAFKKP